MPLFSFGKSGPPPPSDKVWKTAAACLKGMVTQALLAIRKGEVPVIITLFDESHQHLIDFLNSAGVPFQELSNLTLTEIRDLKGAMVLIDACTGSTPTVNIPTEVKANIFILGHYPLLPYETLLLDNIRLTQPTAPIIFCQSLDDALFTKMGTGNLAPLLEQIGLTDDECIEHPLVTKAIHRLQAKISEKVGAEVKARSQREWYERNLE